MSFSAHEAVALSLPEEMREAHSYQVTCQLNALGFPRQQHHCAVQKLSGGQQNLILFARAAVQTPDLLLLDEPGNHMDILAMAALRHYLCQPNTPAFLLISHDRDLLDAVTQKTLWLRDQRAYHFDLPYSAAKQALASRDEADAKKRAAEQKKIDQLSASAKRIANWGRVYNNEDFARKAKSMEKRVDRLKAQQTTVTQGTGLNLSIALDTLKAKQLFTLDQANIRTPEGKSLFSANCFVLKPGDRVALLGANGCGKSTCINTLMTAWRTAVDQQTTIRFNPRVQIGYFDQELTQVSGQLSIMDWLRTSTTTAIDRIKNLLIHWGFPYKTHQQAITQLSGGQRARLLLLKFQLNAPNLLIMDEPTNHLDLEGKEMLETDLCQSGISVLFTSHDRRFLEKVATRYWWIHDGKLIELQDVEIFYETLNTHSAERLAHTQPHKQTLAAEPRHAGQKTELEILETICHLEKLLTEDLARKQKFQKPKRQAQWRAEIKTLTAMLN